MTVTIGKILSLVIAIAYVGLGIAAELIVTGKVSPAILFLCGMLLFPLALIWFPDDIGSFTGFVGHSGYVDTETPAVLISLMGWFFLVGLPILLCFIGP